MTDEKFPAHRAAMPKLATNEFHSGEAPITTPPRARGRPRGARNKKGSAPSSTGKTQALKLVEAVVGLSVKHREAVLGCMEAMEGIPVKYRAYILSLVLELMT